MEEIVGAFGRALHRLRMEKELTQEQLGLQANLQRKHVSALELGKKQANLVTIFKIARALKISTSELLRITEQEMPK